MDAAGVAAGHPLAVAAGNTIVRRGGNAVDVAIATAFADSVLHPEASGIGGGGSAIIADPDAVDYIDYRDEVNISGEIPQSGSGIPGLVAGLAGMHQRFGTLDWGTLLESAIELARDGAPVSDYLADVLESLRVDPSIAPQFFSSDGSTLGAGEQLVQSDLAEVLQIVADQGAEGFYTGEVATRLAEVPGIDVESLAGYEGQWSTPPSGAVGDHVVVSASPALPGAAVIQNLQIAYSLGVGTAAPNSAEFFDFHARAWRHANHSIQTHFGDPNYVDVPTDSMTDPELNAQRSNEEPPDPATDGDAADGNTTHISVVDRDGLTVSMTNTVTNFWGAQIYNQGFFVNDALRRFEDFGEQNTPAPGARSVSWSAPSLLLDAERRPALVLGLPGGRQIPSALATVISLWALHDFSVEDAVMAPRFQLLPTGVLRLEDPELAEPVEALGYSVEVPHERATFGSVQAIAIDWTSGSLSSHADPRRGAAVEIAS